MIKRILAVVTAFLLAAVPLSGCGKNGVRILDKNGGLICEIFSPDDGFDFEEGGYVSLAWNEAALALSRVRSVTEDEAKSDLIKDGAVIRTAFDPECFAAIKRSCEEYASATDFACAVTDLHGKLLATFSSSRDGIDLAVTPRDAYSAFKPLAVYAPAIESGRFTWSSLFLDSPYKQIDDGEGGEYDWPPNASGVYSEKDVTVAEAISQSLNTVAVKCLAGYGVNNSISFLKERFGIDLAAEREKSLREGEDEVIGNVAMGYISEGVTAVEMAGYYQVFAAYGRYIAPYAVLGIDDLDGSVLYECSPIERQCISPQCACVMNHLLEGVVSMGGTGESAAIEGVDVAGKTGTGSNDAGNWFVGVTPGYSVAVWHGGGLGSNRAASAFSKIAGSMDHEQTVFRDCNGVTQIAYCRTSGKRINSNCRDISIGYYLEGTEPSLCDVH